MAAQSEQPMRKPSFNPLACRSDVLPANIVLMVKLIAMGLVMKNYFYDLSDHHLPFWPIFDRLGSPTAFKQTLQFFFVIGIGGILFSQWLRQACFILGTVFMVSVLSSKSNYTNVHFFCANILLLTSLSNLREPLVLLRYQMAIVYFGAGINKILDPDWRSGQYFEHWMKEIIQRDFYIKATSYFPKLFLSKIMCWSTIVTEFFISAGFIVKPLHHLTILSGVYFHSIAFLMAWYDFRVFTIAILSSYLILVRWPDTMDVRYNDRKFFHRLTKNIFHHLDFDRRIRWLPGKTLQMDVFETTHTGFIAFKRLVLYTPFSYFFYVLILGLPNDHFMWLKLKSVQCVLIFFLPWPEAIEYFKARALRNKTS